MRNILVVGALAALVSACATPLPHGRASHDAAGMDPQAMERMHERMHERTAATGAPGGREALAHAHRKPMQDPMQRMGGMGGMCGDKEGDGAPSHQH